MTSLETSVGMLQGDFSSTEDSESRKAVKDIPGKCLGILSPITPRKYYCSVLINVVLLATVLGLVALLMAVNKTENRIPETRLFSSCPRDWIAFGNKCYYFSDDIRNWTSSQAFCASFGANLVKFDSKEELNFLERHRDLYDRWIGLRRESPQHSWKWTDNTKFSNLTEVRGTGECAYLNAVGISSGRFYTELKWICSKPSSYVQCAATSGSFLQGVSWLGLMTLILTGQIYMHIFY
ncbi:C-type lectin domain family 2 member D11-like [Dipodomys merriami]|uniref:C-type lectin domain family 2 member D11-like n=1 Tax=Dipodomys merriami TaxID=94247 RepID=UPI003855E551